MAGYYVTAPPGIYSAPRKVVVSALGKELLPANSQRLCALVVNVGESAAFLAVGTPGVVDAGIALSPWGVAQFGAASGLPLTLESIHAIAGAGKQTTLAVQEISD